MAWRLFKRIRHCLEKSRKQRAWPTVKHRTGRTPAPHGHQPVKVWGSRSLVPREASLITATNSNMALGVCHPLPGWLALFLLKK